MECYYLMVGDLFWCDVDVKWQEVQELDELVQQFLVGGGQIEKVGYKMCELLDIFVINFMRMLVYNGVLVENLLFKVKFVVLCV